VGPLRASIPSGSRVLLDTVALIYYLEEHARYGVAAEELLHRIETEEVQGVLSSLVFAELLVPLYRAGQEGAAAALVDRLRSFRNLAVVDLNPTITSKAAHLRATYGLRTPDAIHAATALVTEATGIVSNDAGFRRLERELRIWLFDDFE
jgi:uncharacterized protein